jgi:glutamine amidotransferase
MAAVDKKRRGVILDCGSGNVTSVFNMVEKFANVSISNDIETIRNASFLILPGVGSFGSVLSKIKSNLPIEEIRNEIADGKPFLGICVGMQVLASKGEEFGIRDGLDLIPGEVKKLPVSKMKLPHIGWNNLNICQESPLLKGINHSDYFYFTHSFGFECQTVENLIAATKFEENFSSVISRENIFGVQFHPEKSQTSGFKLLENFVSLKC